MSFLSFFLSLESEFDVTDKVVQLGFLSTFLEYINNYTIILSMLKRLEFDFQWINGIVQEISRSIRAFWPRLSGPATTQQLYFFHMMNN